MEFGATPCCPPLQERFGAYFAAKPAWQGLVGTAPTAAQFQAAMADYDCLLYLGHGSGDRYLSRWQAVALAWGHLLQRY